jgi:hypothetical protein
MPVEFRPETFEHRFSGFLELQEQGRAVAKTILKESFAFQRSLKRFRTWVGPMAAMCGWTFVGAAVTPIG